MAKKDGPTFSLPISYNRQRRLKIGTVIKNKPVREAISQARKYCYAKGVRFGIITNGTQYVIFEALRFGEEWEKGNCLIFYHMDDIQRSFIEFWNVLSKDAVENNSLVEKVTMDFERLKFTRPVDDISLKNIRQPRNDLSRHLTPIISYGFQEITDQTRIDMLKKCYVYEEEFASADKTLKHIFSMDMPKAYNELDLKKILHREKIDKKFWSHFDKYSKLLEKDTHEPIVFLLLGRVGSGKTTFIHRFFNVVLEEKEKEKVLWFYVNFRDAPADESSIRQYIYDSILEDFFEKYTELFNELRTKYEFEVIGANLKDLTLLFAFLKGLGYTLSIVIDNVDQHRSLSPDYHEKVFIEANSITKKFRTITIMTLREESFYRSGIGGVFDAYYIEKFIIPHPDFVKLIMYRLDYILDKLELPEDEFKQLIRTNLDFDYRLKRIKKFLQIVKDSIARRPDVGISQFMTRTCGGNMRRALELFARFLVSGNTKIQEMLDIYNYSGFYQIAYHHFIKSIILGDYKYYSEESSYLMNLFDFNMNYSNSHFLKLKILNYAKDHLSSDGEIGRGYLSINLLCEEASNISINPKAIDDSLLKLAKYDLIILDTRSKVSLENASYFKITETGNYYLDFLLSRFVYLDLVWADTPIADIDAVTKLRSLLREIDLRKRFERTEIFLEYLKYMEERDIELNPKYKTSDLGKHRFMSKIISRFEKEKNIVLIKTSRNR